MSSFGSIVNTISKNSTSDIRVQCGSNKFPLMCKTLHTDFIESREQLKFSCQSQIGGNVKRTTSGFR